jgi:hypothetical protein
MYIGDEAPVTADPGAKCSEPRPMKWRTVIEL